MSAPRRWHHTVSVIMTIDWHIARIVDPVFCSDVRFFRLQQILLNLLLVIFVPIFLRYGFGGLVVSMLASWYPSSRAQTRPKPSDFFGRKNPQHAFLRKGSKAVCHMSQICGMLKNPVNTWKLGHRQNFPAISRSIVPRFATRSARVVGDVGASGGESGKV
jgi:hypothetical protein